MTELGELYREMQADVYAALRPRKEDLLNETCGVCGKKIDHAAWFVEKVDAYGDQLWGRYVCNTLCMRKVTAVARREQDTSSTRSHLPVVPMNRFT